MCVELKVAAQCVHVMCMKVKILLEAQQDRTKHFYKLEDFNILGRKVDNVCVLCFNQIFFQKQNRTEQSRAEIFSRSEDFIYIFQQKFPQFPKT